MDCEQIRDCIVEYIEGTLDESTKDKVEGHMETCDGCFNEIKAIDKTICGLEKNSRDIAVAPNFLDGIAENILKNYNPKINSVKKQLKRSTIPIAISAGILCAVLAFIIFAPQYFKCKLLNIVTMGKVYDTSDGIFGRKLNISSTYSGIKATVTKVSADDMQTVIYFKVESPDGKGYRPDEIAIKEKWGNQPNITRISNNGNDGFYLYLKPVDTGKKVLHISFIRLLSMSEGNNPVDFKGISGNWSFTVPVKKMDSVSKNIGSKLKLDEGEIAVNNLQIGPTGTKINFYCTNTGNPNRCIESFNIGFQDGEKQYYMTSFDAGELYKGKSSAFSILFDSVYTDNPKNLKLHIYSYQTRVINSSAIQIPINLDGPFPVQFDFLGNTIKIDNLKVSDRMVTFDIIEPKGNRNYNYMSCIFEGNIGRPNMTNQEYYIVDENNVEYDYNDIVNNYNKYSDKNFTKYPTKTTYMIERNSQTDKQISLIISGYTGINKVDKIIPLD
jgi:Predicted transmembrane transcriptional regulator (anti-sigma factor)